MPVSIFHVKFLAVAISLLQVTDGADYCFRSYSDKYSACRGRLHARDYRKDIGDCCKTGQGYAAQLHRSKHAKKWFDCQPCHASLDVKERATSERRLAATSSDRGHVTSAGDPRKTNFVGDKKNSSVHRKKSVGDDKPHRKAAAAADRKAKKIAWSAWTDWGPCSSSCEPGVQQRSRACLTLGCHGDDFQQRTCQPAARRCAVDGGWSLWGPWTECSTSCGHDGVRRRERRCDNPLPQYDGRPCEGDAVETSACPQPTECPVDGGWSEWSHLDACSAEPCSQEIGFRIRFRSCTSPSPMFGGLPCQGRSWKRETCYNNDFCTKPVDGAWCAWSDWTECDSGLRHRQRSCECPPPVSGGLQCHGDSVQTVTCGELTENPERNDSQCDAESSGDGTTTCDSEDDESGSGNDDSEN